MSAPTFISSLLGSTASLGIWGKTQPFPTEGEERLNAAKDPPTPRPHPPWGSGLGEGQEGGAPLTRQGQCLGLLVVTREMKELRV